MDTPEFGEVTKQKIGYRLREVLNGKKTKAIGHDNDRVYIFDTEKLRRIAVKYGCPIADKQTTPTGFKDVSAPEIRNHFDKLELVSENESIVNHEETEKRVQTPQKVVQLIHSSASMNLEDLAVQIKTVTQLPPDFGIETCVACGAKPRRD